MKRLIILIIFLCSEVVGLECGDEYYPSSSVLSHLENATDVFFGLPISGECVEENCHEIKFNVKVLDVLKGDVGPTISVKNYHHSLNNIQIGRGYVIFLYGTNNIGSCGLVLEAGYPSATDDYAQYLIDNSDRVDISSAPLLRELLTALGRLP